MPSMKPGERRRSSSRMNAKLEKLLIKGYRWIEETGEDMVARLHAARRQERERRRRHS